METLDEKDKKILEILVENSKLTSQEISKKTLIPMTTVHNRIKKLEQKGIIKNYTVNLDLKKLGKTISAYMLITIDFKGILQETTAKNIKALDGVIEIASITGQTDLIVKVALKDMNTLNDFIINKLRSIEGVTNTQTLVVLNEYES